MDIVRLGIIGLGNMGYSHVLNYLNGKLKNVRLTAVCDIDPQRLETVKKELDPEVKAFVRSEDLIRSGEVDAIVIATPHYFHPTIAIDGFKNGLNVLTEKPAGVLPRLCVR